VARMARERGTLGVVLDSLSEKFVGRRGSVFGGMAAITTCCVLVVMSISSPEVADKIMLQSGEGDIYPEGSELASESRLSFVESSNSAGSEITPRSEIRILPFSRSLPIDFVSARPNTFLQASPSRQGRHMQGDLPPWNATQMSFENHVSNSTEDYPLTSGTFDPFLFDDLLGQAYENNSSEAEVRWGSSLPPQIAVSGNYKGGRGTVGNDAVTRHDGGLERSTPSSVILREQIIPKTNFASR
ncbi:MAG: hypothetical protein ACO3XO_08455, partial [Bdellovibrionota bacterium]